MRKAGLYLDGQRFEVASLEFQVSSDVLRRGRRLIPGLSDARLIGRVFVPPRCNVAQFIDTSAPVTVRYRDISGPFWLSVAVDIPKKSLTPLLTFEAVAAGAVKCRAPKRG